MKATPTFLLTLLTTIALPAQEGAKLKKDLAAKETAAKKDPEALFAVGKWAADHSLDADAKRLYEAVLKIAPDHAGANQALGREEVEGKWYPAAEAEKLRRQVLTAKYAAQGLVEVDGVWVDKDQVDKAKRGVFFHEGEAVTKEEKLLLLQGMVRHPRTGQLIATKDLERAKGGQFPIGDAGRWVDEKEADQWHSDPRQPWIVRTTYATLIGTHPLAKLDAARQQVDRAIEHVRPLLGAATIDPANRPVILAASTLSEYRDYGATFGDGTDACGAFLMREGLAAQVANQGAVRAAVCNLQDENGWGPYYLRHAAGLAYAQAVTAAAGADLPLWLLHGFGSYCSRFENESDGGYFGKLHVKKGGVGDLAPFFAGFAISGDMESLKIDYNIYQAGLMVEFGAHGGDATVTSAMQAISAALGDGKGSKVDAAVKSFETALAAAKPAIVAHLEKLIAKAP